MCAISQMLVVPVSSAIMGDSSILFVEMIIARLSRPTLILRKLVVGGGLPILSVGFSRLGKNRFSKFELRLEAKVKLRGWLEFVSKLLFGIIFER
jgi:hypothetical protein